ncbi:hypothetical protein QQ020_02325 [Fulvivirgaceae bacterium BMA12]|uniref:Polymerase/histidinol phosphatase N-terminal domain-containing protein n=1 Tax=Agaribacillus aureus TaxID=3051825 RepID=A0ABT8L3P0_9BACT|nr:hypothetical protein [Fulvivirgaceae bacterium BMA12]
MNLVRTVKKILRYTLLLIVLLVAIVMIVLFGPALLKNWVTYPKLEKERAQLWAKYKKPDQYIGREVFQGALHVHSYWSHDSRGTLPEILDAAKKANLDFIFYSDHARGKLDTFPRGYGGVFDGVLMEAGTESGNGLMVNPFDSVVLDWNKETDTLIHEAVAGGGLVAYVHTERDHSWHNPDYQAMEIYNIHTDLLDEDGILPFLINNIVNGGRFKHWCYRELYDEQTAILNNWDSLNLSRQIVGIAGVDAHNNQGLRAHYLEDGRVEWVGSNAKTLTIREPGWLDKLLLGEPDAFGWAFKWELDTYYHSFNFVTNHVFCDTLSTINIKEHIIKGHVYISFESLARAKGFQYFTINQKDSVTGILGDSVRVADVNRLKAVSPLPVKYQLYNSGKLIDEVEEAYEYAYTINGKTGNYRIVALVNFNDQWIPWVYTNQIYIY